MSGVHFLSREEAARIHDRCRPPEYVQVRSITASWLAGRMLRWAYPGISRHLEDGTPVLVKLPESGQLLLLISER